MAGGNGTTPYYDLKVIVGGTHTVQAQPASWVELDQDEIGPKGREDVDGTLYVEGSGWRLMDRQTEGYTTYDAGAATSRVLLPDNGTATLAIYADGGGESLKVKPGQRHLSELGVPLGTQTAQGYYEIHKNARPLGGLGPDWTDYPPPTEDEPVPLDRCLVGTEQIDGDDRTHVSWSINGRSGSILGPVFRYYFPGLAGTTRDDYNAGQKGTGRYALTFRGDSLAVLREVVQSNDPDAEDPAPEWRYRATFRYCPDNQVIGFTHSLTVETDARRDGNGKLYGKSIKFVFSNLGGAYLGQIRDTVLDLTGAYRSLAGALGPIAEYQVPGVTSINQPIPSLVRIDARQDVALTFRPSRLVFRSTGILRTQAITLEGEPEGGIFEVQAFGSIPAGTSIDIAAYGATSGAACTGATTVTDPADRSAKFVKFNAIDGERAYLLVVTFHASSDFLKTPTVRRIRARRAAIYRTVEDAEVEITTLTMLSCTGQSADPTTETMGFVCWDLTGAQNEILRKRSGMPIRAEISIKDPANPDVPPKKSVIFRGRVVNAKRHRRAGKGKQGFNGTGPALRDGPLTKYDVRCVGEWEALSKKLAPGRLDITADPNVVGLEAGRVATMKVTDLLRILMEAAIDPARVDVPDLPFRLPISGEFKTYIERYTPIMPIVLSLVRDYLGGFLWRDDNAGTEGIWRVMLGAKKPFRPVIELCREPVVSGITVVHPAAYPDGDGISGSGEEVESYKIRRTFMRQGPDSSWIEKPRVNQVVVRGVGDTRVSGGSALTIRAGVGSIQAVFNNWKAASFPTGVDASGNPLPKQGTPGGPPAPDVDHIDYSDGEPCTLYHADPGLNTNEALLMVGMRLFHINAHAKRWETGEAPLVLLTPATTGGDKLSKPQTQPRPPRFGDVALIKNDEGVTEEYVFASSPSIHMEGKLGGSRFVHFFYELYSAPPTEDYRAAYAEAY